MLIAWSASNPERVGEVVLVAPRGAALEVGRGTAEWVRQRPGENRDAGPLSDPRLSRRQIRVQGLGARLQVENLGRCPLEVNGEQVQQAVLSPGDALRLGDQLVLLCTRRPAVLPIAQSSLDVPWARADGFGMVGESPAAWALREQIQFIAPRAGHVLVLGRSGTGKELVAKALHDASGRRGQFVPRNAATIPPSLVDAELFGHARDYPNAGMPARPGLVGEADGGTLFLDEIGELPEALQARLLRLMDAGEYTRLGTTGAQRADIRVVAATNRERDALKHDVLARFRHVVEVPDLGARGDDVPLLVAHLLRSIAAEDADIARRFYADDTVRVAPELVLGLLAHDLPLQVRELDHLLWRCLAASKGDRVEAIPDLRIEPSLDATTDPSVLTVEDIKVALERCEGSRERAWRELGLQSRYQLRRLMRKFDLG